MSNSAATEALEASLARDSATPDFGDGDRETYLEQKRSELRSCIIEPVPVVAYASAWAQQHLGLSSEPSQMIAVAYWAGEVGNCLLYNPGTGLFSLAYGHLSAPGDMELVGYSSDDALAMWLG